jgi:hypothetical protein
MISQNALIYTCHTKLMVIIRITSLVLFLSIALLRLYETAKITFTISSVIAVILAIYAVAIYMTRGPQGRNTWCKQTQTKYNYYQLFCVMGVYNIYLPTYSSIHPSMALQPFVGPWPIFQFLDLLHSW